MFQKPKCVISLLLNQHQFHVALHNFGKSLENSKVYDHSLKECIEIYTDKSVKGMVIIFRDTRYKKKLSVEIDTAYFSDCFEIENVLKEYFQSKYELKDFKVSGVNIKTDINTGDPEIALAYSHIMRHIGRVKAFTIAHVPEYGSHSYCWHGNNNGVEFVFYNFAEYMEKEKLSLNDNQSYYDAMGLVCIQANLFTSIAINHYLSSDDGSKQVDILLKNYKSIFYNVAIDIIPHGHFYRKDMAVKIIRKEISNKRLAERMIQMIELIIVKKSIYLASKYIGSQNKTKVLDAFREIDLSPITIAVRCNMKHLSDIYSLMEQ